MILGGFICIFSRFSYSCTLPAVLRSFHGEISKVYRKLLLTLCHACKVILTVQDNPPPLHIVFHIFLICL